MLYNIKNFDVIISENTEIYSTDFRYLFERSEINYLTLIII